MSKLAQPILGHIVNDDGTSIVYAILGNPHPDRVPNDTFEQIIVDGLQERAAELKRLHDADEVKQPGMGFALTDWTAPPYVSSLDAIIVLASINGGRKYTVNGIDKAVNHRNVYLSDIEQDFDLELADLKEVFERQPLRLPDGAFGWNGSAYYKGGFSGGSGASTVQDRHHGLALLKSVYDAAEVVAKEWQEGRDRGWLNDDNQPNEEVTALAAILEEAEEELPDPIEAYGPDASSRSTVYQAD